MCFVYHLIGTAERALASAGATRSSRTTSVCDLKVQALTGVRAGAVAVDGRCILVHEALSYRH